MVVTAPAKINLTLRVLRKREDGFHELETLIYPLPQLHDRLTVEKAAAFQLTCTDETVPVDETNLVTKAVRALEKKTDRDLPCQIHLEKRIPHGAGLGGGSSDAASTLLALNDLFSLDFSLDELSAIGAELGSDVPVFLYQVPCWCRGRGEQITPAPEVQLSGPVLLLKPSFGVATPDAYKRWQASRELQGVSYAPQTVDRIGLVNDLERPVFEKHLFLAELKTFLQSQPGVRAAMMSGSGSTVFALLEKDCDGEKLGETVKRMLDPTLSFFLLAD